MDMAVNSHRGFWLEIHDRQAYPLYTLIVGSQVSNCCEQDKEMILSTIELPEP